MKTAAFALLILYCSTIAAQHSEPRVRFRIEPTYTKQAKKKKIEGLVSLTCTIGKDGVPGDITITRSLDSELDQKAVDALHRWVFWPATSDGKPISKKATIDFSFILKKR